MRTIVAGLATALVLSGCSTFKNFTLPEVEQDFVYASDILYSFECEIVESLRGNIEAGGSRPGSDFFKDKAVTANFELTAKRIESQPAALDLTIPAGLAQIAIGTSTSASRTSTRIFDFNAVFNANSEELCSPKKFGDHSVTRIGSGLGVIEWASQMGQLERLSNGEISVVNYQVEFEIKNDLKASPSLSRSNTDGLSRKLSFTPSNAKNSKHALTISVGPLPKSSRSPSARVPQSTQENIQRNLDNFLDRVSD